MSTNPSVGETSSLPKKLISLTAVVVETLVVGTAAVVARGSTDAGPGGPAPNGMVRSPETVAVTGLPGAFQT